jgi:23S rRNA-/tRNA-specific pseudouridylate synthase
MTAQSGMDRGREAVTLYHVVARYPQYTLLDIQIVTGRTHQIRAHLFSIGHSIVGDVLYTTRNIRKKRIASPLDRPFLYAYALSFRDPNGQKRDYTVELPQHLKNFLTTLPSLV